MTPSPRNLLSVLTTLMLVGCAPRPASHASAPQRPHPVPTMPPVAMVRPPIPLASTRQVAPGILWRQYSGLSPRWHEPLFINVLEFDPRDPRYCLEVVQARGPAPSHRESARRIAHKVGAIAAINGSYFNFVPRRTNGDPIGLVLADGHLVNPARGDRPAMGIMPDGRVFFGTPVRKRDLLSALQLDRLDALNPQPPVVSLIRRTLPLHQSPLQALFAFLRRQTADAAPDPRPTLTPAPYLNTTGLGYPWNEARQALEGGPMLLHDGKTVPLRGFNWSILKGREPRTAVGLTRSGKMLWVTVDGRVPGHSMGTNLAEVTQLFQSLGAVEALNWDGGGSTTMIVKGNLVTRIATGWVREVTNALVLVPASGSTSTRSGG